MWSNSVHDHLAHYFSWAILGKNGVFVYWFCSTEFVKQASKLYLCGYTALPRPTKVTCRLLMQRSDEIAVCQWQKVVGISCNRVTAVTWLCKLEYQGGGKPKLLGVTIQGFRVIPTDVYE